MKRADELSAESAHRVASDESAEAVTAAQRDARLSELLEVRPSAIHGLGAFARRAIPAETLIGEYVGPHLDQNGPYVLWVDYEDGEQVAIDGRNELRYLNHSATPNAYFWGHELYAARDIAAGEELTWDYGEDFAAHLSAPDQP